MASRSARRRYCRCGTYLAADNIGRQCAQCERISRDKLIAPPHVPAEFWQTQQFRDAFDAQHIGRVSRAYRTHPHHHAVYGSNGISQTLLGQWLGLHQPQISRIETGPPIRNLDTLAYWVKVLRIPPRLLWFRLPADKPVTEETTSADPPLELPFTQVLLTSTNEQTDEQLSADGGRGVPSDPMRRRTLVTWGLTTTAIAGRGVGSLGQVGTAEVIQLQGSTARLHALDQRHGGETLWKAAAAGVREAYLKLEHATYSSSVGQQLLKATARLQLCAGWLAFDAGRHDVAQTSYTDALMLARQAGDSETEIRAFSLLALRSNILGRPREARRLAITASQIKAPTGGSPLLTAIPPLRQAVASSLMSEMCESDQAITEARRALERDHDGPIEQWCAFLNSMKIDAVEATCALEANRPSRAAALLERAITGYGDNNQYARNRALYRVRLAHARLDMRAVDGATEAANVAIDDLSQQLSS